MLIWAWHSGSDTSGWSWLVAGDRSTPRWKWVRCHGWRFLQWILSVKTVKVCLNWFMGLSTDVTGFVPTIIPVELYQVWLRPVPRRRTANSNPVCSANNLEYQPFHCILIECVFFASKIWSLNCTFPVVYACLCDDSSSCPYINSHTLRHIKINMQNPLFRDDFERKLWLVHIISLVHCTISGKSPMYPHFLVRFARTLPITYIGRIARFSYKPILVLSWFSVHHPIPYHIPLVNKCKWRFPKMGVQ